MRFKKKPYKLIYFETDDITTRTGWHSQEDAEKWFKGGGFILREVMFLVAEDRYAIYGCTRINDETEYNTESLGVLHRVPKNWIRKRKIIKS